LITGFYIILGIYSFVILALVRGFNRLKTPINFTEEPLTSFSVVIPFKDEAEHLPELLTSLSQLNYPTDLFEIILINDASSDDSVAIIETFKSNAHLNINLLHSDSKSLSPKKEALTKAIHFATNKWIITSDADCTFHSNWLKTYDGFIQKNKFQFIAGPVAYKSSNKFLDAFQLLDFSSLIGVTMGSFGLKKPIMCNGANLAYKKSLFDTLGGFKGHDTIASGDDVFFLEKVVKYNKTLVSYLKHEQAIVHTKPVTSLKLLLPQRLRWASKTGQSSLIETKLLGFLVLITNTIFIFALLNLVISTFSLIHSLVLISLKLGVDAILLYKTLSFFRQNKMMSQYGATAFLYPFFTVYIAILSLFGGYKWKNRAYKR
jgi:biofilm PGA synthesis N-glycosyltransferase PgaC